jgi:hypothetical protein
MNGGAVSAYTILGVEQVYDAFDEYEHAYPRGPITVEAKDASDAYAKAERILSDAIRRDRGAQKSSGTFVAEVIRILDPGGRCIFQNSDSLRRYWGAVLEDHRTDVPAASCFMSYNHYDEEFVTRLYGDLSRSFYCWFAPASLAPGHLERALRAAIASSDLFLAVLSKRSVQSRWVEFEVKAVLTKEAELGRRLAFPVFLDADAQDADLPWVRSILRHGHGVSFLGWREPERYFTALRHLEIALTSESLG